MTHDDAQVLIILVGILVGGFAGHILSKLFIH